MGYLDCPVAHNCARQFLPAILSEVTSTVFNLVVVKSDIVETTQNQIGMYVECLLFARNAIRYRRGGDAPPEALFLGRLRELRRKYGHLMPSICAQREWI